MTTNELRTLLNQDAKDNASKWGQRALDYYNSGMTAWAICAWREAWRNAVASAR